MACKPDPLTNGYGSITCGFVHDVVIAKGYLIEPPAPASGCSDEKSLVAHRPIIIGSCHNRYDDTGLVGMKAACDGQKVVMNKYAAFDCNGWNGVLQFRGYMCTRIQ
ncbi:unnamed protein product [Polarella glacialis]|uniref:Uncharacterized protein n=1 Tax=Polarella glacialis TaxID=89957 RepID=A0A813JG24_POLGL|nr:unnamed protein product [Polarella glacialis]